MNALPVRQIRLLESPREFQMKTPLRAAGAIALFFAFTASLTAQWPTYPTPGTPRTPEGQVKLDAPAPKTADGKPDLSGV
jgi:hypothetical protein